MRTAVIAILMLLAGLLQSAIPGAALLAGSKVPLLLAVALYYAANHEWRVAAVVAGLAGFVQDSLSLFPLGSSAFCFLVLALIVSAVRDYVFRESIVTALVVGALGAAAMTLGLWGLLVLGRGLPTGPAWWLGLKVAGSALWGGVVTPPVWWVARSWERLVGAEAAAR